jgi:putative Holliday junction resolvase
MKYLAIDYGTKRIGTAVSDDSGTLAFPRDIFPTNADVYEKIAHIVRGEEVTEIIVGNSLTGGGKENLVMRDAHVFIEKLRAVISATVPITLYNEFGTTAAVLSARIHSDGAPRRQASPSARDTNNLDAQAAMMLLQRYLDGKH